MKKVCESCETNISYGVWKYSKWKYAQPLCQDCQGKVECSECGDKLHELYDKKEAEKVAGFSKRRYGRYICRDCQNELRKSDKGLKTLVQKKYEEVKKEMVEFMNNNNEENEKILEFLAGFRSYSPANSWSIHRKLGTTIVKGKRQWEKEGVELKNDAKGAEIFVPVFKTEKESFSKDEFDKNSIPDKKGYRVKKVKDEGDKWLVTYQKNSPFFKTAKVYAIYETDAETPEFLKERFVKEDPLEISISLISSLENFCSNEGIEVEFSNSSRDRFGKSSFKGGHSEGGKIAINNSRPKPSQLKTLFHEIAHELLHWDNKGRKLSSSEKESEAELVAFVCMDFFGFETSSSKYLANHLPDLDDNNIRKMLRRIRKPIRKILGFLEENLEFGEKNKKEEKVAN